MVHSGYRCWHHHFRGKRHEIDEMLFIRVFPILVLDLARLDELDQFI